MTTVGLIALATTQFGPKAIVRAIVRSKRISSGIIL